jgi:hypothetical protein
MLLEIKSLLLDLMWYVFSVNGSDWKETQRIPEGMKIPGDPASQQVQYPLEYSDLRLVWTLDKKLRKKWEEMSKKPLIDPSQQPKKGWR